MSLSHSIGGHRLTLAAPPALPARRRARSTQPDRGHAPAATIRPGARTGRRPANTRLVTNQVRERAIHHLPDGEAGMGGRMSQRSLGTHEEKVRRRRPRRAHSSHCSTCGSSYYVAGRGTRRRPGAPAASEMRREQRALPQVARFCLREETRVDGGEHRERQSDDRDRHGHDLQIEPARQQMKAQHHSKGRENERAAHQPAFPLRPREDQIEALGMFEVADEQHAGESRARRAKQRARSTATAGSPRRQPRSNKQSRDQIDAGGDALRPRVEAQPASPRATVRDVVGRAGPQRSCSSADGCPETTCFAARSACSLHMNRPPSGRCAASGSSVA